MPESGRDPEDWAEAKARALDQILREKGHVADGATEAIHGMWDEWVPENGARVVARAWTDEDFRERLLADGAAACVEMGVSALAGSALVVLENTPTLQNAVVCTLCSCTAWPVIGLPADWYKSFEDRSRVVREARKLLSEMGLDLPPEVKIQVWDTTADTRYMVLPFRPEGTENWPVEALAAIVTKECLVGVSRPKVGN